MLKIKINNTNCYNQDDMDKLEHFLMSSNSLKNICKELNELYYFNDDVSEADKKYYDFKYIRENMIFDEVVDLNN